VQRELQGDVPIVPGAKHRIDLGTEGGAGEGTRMHQLRSLRDICSRSVAVSLLKWALIFLVVSIIAGLLGFTGISAASADVARVLFYIFVVIFLVLLVLGLTIFRA